MIKELGFGVDLVTTFETSGGGGTGGADAGDAGGAGGGDVAASADLGLQVVVDRGQPRGGGADQRNSSHTSGAMSLATFRFKIKAGISA